MPRPQKPPARRQKLRQIGVGYLLQLRELWVVINAAALSAFRCFFSSTMPASWAPKA
jgi:hypothetical protein